MKSFIAPSAAVFALVSLAALSSASIASFDATDVMQITSTSDMKYTANAYSSPVARVWNERQGFTLTSALAIDAVDAGTYDLLSQLDAAAIPAGTVVDSHYFSFDPLFGNDLTTTVGFGGKILGVIATSDRAFGLVDRLFASDGLILPGVPAANKPSAHYANRALEFRSLAGFAVQDAFTINANNSITFDLTTLSPGDGVRVITQAVPEPSAFAALGLGALGFLRRRRK